MENEEFASVSELALRLAGSLQAMEVIQDVLVSTLLLENPDRALVMEQHLQARYDLVPGSLDGVALKAFQERISNFRYGLQLLGPQST